MDDQTRDHLDEILLVDNFSVSRLRPVVELDDNDENSVVRPFVCSQSL